MLCRRSPSAAGDHRGPPARRRALRRSIGAAGRHRRARRLEEAGADERLGDGVVERGRRSVASCSPRREPGPAAFARRWLRWSRPVAPAPPRCRRAPCRDVSDIAAESVVGGARSRQSALSDGTATTPMNPRGHAMSATDPTTHAAGRVGRRACRPRSRSGGTTRDHRGSRWSMTGSASWWRHGRRGLRRALRVLETAGAPVYYVPREDVRMDLVRRRSTDPLRGKGDAATGGRDRRQDRREPPGPTRPEGGLRGDHRPPCVLCLASRRGVGRRRA